MPGFAISKLILTNSIKLAGLARDFVFGEIEKWAEDNLRDEKLRAKLRALRIEVGHRMDDLQGEVAGVLSELVAERDKTIADLEVKIDDLSGDADHRKALRLEINAVVQWMVALEAEMQRHYDHVNAPNANEGGQGRVHAPIAPDLREIPTHTEAGKKILEVSDWCGKANRAGFVVYKTLADRFPKFQKDLDVIYDLLKAMSRQKNLRIDFPPERAPAP